MSVVSAALQKISGDHLQRKVVSFLEVTEGNKGWGWSWSCSSGRRSNQGRVHGLGLSGMCSQLAEVSGRGLKTALKRDFTFLYIGWVQLLELGKAKPETVDVFVFVVKALGVVGEPRLSLLGQGGVE